VIHVGRAFGDGIESLESADDLAGGIDAHIQRTAGHAVDVGGDIVGGGAQAGEIGRPGRHHAQAFHAAIDRRCGRSGRVLLPRLPAGSCHRRSGDGATADECASIHVSPP